MTFFKKPSRKNGDSAEDDGPTLDAADAKKRAAAAKRVAASFGEIVTLLMRSRVHKHLTLTDLEWLVVPALTTGQLAIADAQSKDTGHVTPAAAVLWALVSPEVDRRLFKQGDQVQLKAKEWQSGDIPWIMMALGDRTITGNLLKRVTKTIFKGRSPKMRTRGPDGKIVVRQFDLPKAN